MMMIQKRSKKKQDDILSSLKKRLRKQLSEEERIARTEKKRKERMARTRTWSLKHGNGKIPTWTEINWSPAKTPVMVHRAWWMVHSIPTRVRTKTLKSGKKRYYLDIYNHTARQLAKSRKQVKIRKR